jgi:hypothetical protein
MFGVKYESCWCKHDSHLALIDAHDLVDDVILVDPVLPRLKADQGEDPSQIEIMGSCVAG